MNGKPKAKGLSKSTDMMEHTLAKIKPFVITKNFFSLFVFFDAILNVLEQSLSLLKQLN